MRAVLYPGIGEGLAPFVLDRKSGYTIDDVDGNVFLDLASASASVPLGACRDDLIDPAVEAIRRFGNEDSHVLTTESPSSSPSGWSRSHPARSREPTSR